jgi:hypothetical protein
MLKGVALLSEKTAENSNTETFNIQMNANLDAETLKQIILVLKAHNLKLDKKEESITIRQSQTNKTVN